MCIHNLHTEMHVVISELYGWIHILSGIYFWKQVITLYVFYQFLPTLPFSFPQFLLQCEHLNMQYFCLIFEKKLDSCQDYFLSLSLFFYFPIFFLSFCLSVLFCFVLSFSILGTVIWITTGVERRSSAMLFINEIIKFLQFKGSICNSKNLFHSPCLARGMNIRGSCLFCFLVTDKR